MYRLDRVVVQDARHILGREKDALDIRLRDLLTEKQECHDLLGMCDI